jgi:hypothetical protein
MASSVEADGILRKSLLRTDILRMLEVELKEK